MFSDFRRFLSIGILFSFSLSKIGNAQCLEGDCTEGPGKIRFESGGIYEGNFKLGKPNGKGIYNGSQYKYSGEYLDGKFNGLGVYENDKLKYEGFFIDNKFDGGGKLSFFDGESYIGNFSNNLKSGLGRYIFQDSSYYDGEWQNDRINGKGTMYLKGRYRLQGKWTNGELEGNGFGYYDSGDNYEGEFKNSLPDGYGILYLRNGGKMVGNWREGQFESGLDNKNAASFSNDPNIVKLKENGGIFEVPAKVNNYEVDFILNTASTMTLLSEEFVNNLIKNNSINETDLLNTKSFTKENGEFNDLVKIKIKEFKIGNAIIQNIVVGICPKSLKNDYPTIREPLILGQNVLREIGKFQIDYKNRILSVIQQ